MRPDGLTHMSSEPVADEFWTRTTPLAVAAPSELNVIVGPWVMREPFSSVCQPFVSVWAPVYTFPPGHGTTVPEQSRVRLFGLVCSSALNEMPRVTASCRPWFSATPIVRAAPSVSCALEKLRYRGKPIALRIMITAVSTTSSTTEKPAEPDRK